MKALFLKYKHAWVLLYFFIYAPWFSYLEKTVTTKFHEVHIKLDDYIPFVEVFAIPYFLWFAFIFVTVAYFFLKDKKEFYRSTAFLFIGMTICLIIYSIWPNGQALRPDLTTIGRDNIFIDIIASLYKTDTPTNVCPSIHAYNSIGACIAIFHCEHLKNKRYVTVPTVILAILICLSTVFLKQHSFFDVICAVVLSCIMYLAVYVPDYEKIFERRRARVKSLAAHE